MTYERHSEVIAININAVHVMIAVRFINTILFDKGSNIRLFKHSETLKFENLESKAGIFSFIIVCRTSHYVILAMRKFRSCLNIPRCSLSYENKIQKASKM